MASPTESGRRSYEAGKLAGKFELFAGERRARGGGERRHGFVREREGDGDGGETGRWPELVGRGGERGISGREKEERERVCRNLDREGEVEDDDVAFY